MAFPPIPDRPTAQQMMALTLAASFILERDAGDLNATAIMCVNACAACPGNAHRPFRGDCATHGCLREVEQRKRWAVKGIELPVPPPPGAPRGPVTEA